MRAAATEPDLTGAVAEGRDRRSQGALIEVGKGEGNEQDLRKEARGVEASGSPPGEGSKRA
jgi:hypothetical protein